MYYSKNLQDIAKQQAKLRKLLQELVCRNCFIFSTLGMMAYFNP
jgi:hypothetical protein